MAAAIEIGMERVHVVSCQTHLQPNLPAFEQLPQPIRHTMATEIFYDVLVIRLIVNRVLMPRIKAFFEQVRAQNGEQSIMPCRRYRRTRSCRVARRRPIARRRRMTSMTRRRRRTTAPPRRFECAPYASSASSCGRTARLRTAPCDTGRGSTSLAWTSSSLPKARRRFGLLSTGGNNDTAASGAALSARSEQRLLLPLEWFYQPADAVVEQCVKTVRKRNQLAAIWYHLVATPIGRLDESLRQRM